MFFHTLFSINIINFCSFTTLALFCLKVKVKSWNWTSKAIISITGIWSWWWTNYCWKYWTWFKILLIFLIIWKRFSISQNVIIAQSIKVYFSLYSCTNSIFNIKVFFWKDTFFTTINCSIGIRSIAILIRIIFPIIILVNFKLCNTIIFCSNHFHLTIIVKVSDIIKS